MIAIYYVEHSGPYQLYVLTVKSTTRTDFLEALKENEYPFPWENDEILFIKNDAVVAQEFLEDLK